ncbi:acidic repeat-containing protein isoform X2 [Biomphalaria glabrata]|uniref:Peptidase S1 domain-containing protein n=1 Tax=Biomphalaria glabrata TaxID=6526 RepID=A0A2C9L3T7_BIOGL|nr:acidic repeat-containing protein isoform X2 [Biomphalaria glabrata]
MSDATRNLLFTKCQSEAEIREVGKQWKESEEKCTNPHKDYIEIKDMSSKLEPQFKILETLLERIAKLTVRIKIPIETKPPSANRESVFGTGFIPRVRRQWDKTEPKEYGVITVSTVHHVISPDSAKGKTIDYEKATIKINFDSVDAEVKRATGFKILESDKDINTYDWCSFECTTDNLELIDTLSKHISSLEEEQKKAYEFYKASQKAPKTSDVHKDDDSSEQTSHSADFVAVISHPHGGPKKGSFGRTRATKEILKQVRDQQEWCCYFHDALTCAGSSGSPVFILGQPLCGYGYWFGHPHNHSGKRDDGLKVTSIGVDHIETTSRPY